MTFVKGVLHLVFTRGSHEEPLSAHPVDTLLLSQTGKQPCFIQWQKAEWLSLILPYPLYPVGWHLFHVFQARK